VITDNAANMASAFRNLLSTVDLQGTDANDNNGSLSVSDDEGESYYGKAICISTVPVQSVGYDGYTGHVVKAWTNTQEPLLRKFF
jgi:hypothetical protein